MGPADRLVSNDPNVVSGRTTSAGTTFTSAIVSNNTTVLVSPGSGEPGTTSYSPSISPEWSLWWPTPAAPSNLVCRPACDKNGTLDIYLYNLDKRINTRISRASKANPMVRPTPSVSGDGKLGGVRFDGQ